MAAGIAAAVVILGLGFGVATGVLRPAGFRIAPASAQSAPAQTAAPPGVPVTAGVARRQDVPIMFHNIGSVQALESVLIRSRVDGTIDKIMFTEGQEVKQGDQLAQIDPRPYAAALAQVLAKRAADIALLANMRRDLGRYSSLAKDQFATQQSVDTQAMQVSQQQANIQADDAAVMAAQLNLDFTRITAPFDGRVGLRQVDPGNLVHANDQQGIVTITRVKPISVVFTLPQRDLPAVRDALDAGEKLPVFAYTGDDSRQLGQGVLLTPDNTIDQSTGTIKFKATFPNENEQLWPGQFVDVRMQVGTRKGAVTVPSPAIQHGPDGLYVYVIKPDQTVTRQPVTVSQDDGQIAVVAKGLDAGQAIVVSGQSRLTNGTRVAASTPETPAPTARPAG